MSTTPPLALSNPFSQSQPSHLTLESNDPTLLSPSPTKHLRSCLSPTRSSSTPPRSPPSRADSFSSSTSTLASGSGSGSEWRTTKSVRWEGEDIGCAVTSYFATYSSAEYDRTPLEPPSEAERTCVLPARGSRCLRISPHDMYSPSSPSSNTPLCESPIEDGKEDREGKDHMFSSSDALSILMQHGQDEEEGEGENTTEDDEREWEECMDRRRMMFAMRQSGVHESGGAGGNGSGVGVGCPEFEGYRSISKSLVEMLRSVGVGRGNVSPPIIEEEEGVEGESEEGRREGLFERLRSDDGDDRRGGMDTPSLVSSEGSEVECCTLGSPEVVVVTAEGAARGSKLLEREIRLEVDDD